MLEAIDQVGRHVQLRVRGITLWQRVTIEHADLDARRQGIRLLAVLHLEREAHVANAGAEHNAATKGELRAGVDGDVAPDFVGKSQGPVQSTRICTSLTVIPAVVCLAIDVA